MAHFAKIVNGVVHDVIVVSNEDCGNVAFPESEPIGQAFLASLGLEGEWKQTSYNTYRDFTAELDEEKKHFVSIVYLGSKHRDNGTPFRGQYANIGGTYDADLDEFVAPPTESDTNETDL